MTDGEIRGLAREYVNANWISESEAYYEGKRQIGIDDILPIFMWLSQRYCIVPQSVLRERYKESELQSISNSRIDMVSGTSRMILLESIFGKDMFEEEGI